ncbi:hypothetical protein PQX77_019013 [Marasmius sp. AFHP31]|nr:hypothetical protein PQX77_019013 [Marasmius sp. AFHP31]
MACIPDGYAAAAFALLTLEVFHMLDYSWNRDSKPGHDQAPPLYQDVFSLKMFEDFDMGLELLALHHSSPCNNPAPLIRLLEGLSNLTSLSRIDTYFMDITIVRLLRAVGKSLQRLILSGQIFEHLFERSATDPRFLSNLEELTLRAHHGITIPSLQPPSSIANGIEARSIRSHDRAFGRLRSMYSEELHGNVTIFNRTQSWIRYVRMLSKPGSLLNKIMRNPDTGLELLRENLPIFGSVLTALEEYAHLIMFRRKGDQVYPIHFSYSLLPAFLF